MNDGLYRATRIVNATPQVCGFEIRDGVVWRAAPLIRRQVLGVWATRVSNKLWGWHIEYVPAPASDTSRRDTTPTPEEPTR